MKGMVYEKRAVENVSQMTAIWKFYKILTALTKFEQKAIFYAYFFWLMKYSKLIYSDMF